MVLNVYLFTDKMDKKAEMQKYEKQEQERMVN